MPVSKSQVLHQLAPACAAATFAVSFMAMSGNAFAEKVCGANVNDGGASITIQNNLTNDLIFKQTTNRQDIEIWSDPPKTIKAGQSGCFVVAPGDSASSDQHLNIKYSIDQTNDEVGVVFKHDYDANKHCPKDHPDWVTEDVKNCGHWDDISDGELWEYIFSSSS